MRFFSIAYSPDGKEVATASEDRTIKIWDPNTGKEFLQFVRGVRRSNGRGI